MKTAGRFLSKTPFIFLFLMGVSFTPISHCQAATRGIRVVSKTGQALSIYKDYYALVVGVSNYAMWPKLPNATKDAREVGRRLEHMGFTVKLILDPTSLELKAALNALVYKIGRKKDRAILLYYAGHGETEKLADGTKLGYIIPADCPLIKDDPQGFSAHAVSMRDIESISLRIRSKHVIMLFDSCFSGSIFALTRAVPEDISEKSALPVRQYITAGGENEQVPDRSMFKRSFLIALEGDADLTGDGYITGSELGMYLSDKVVNYTHRRQHPQYGKINNPDLDRGDFIFIPVKEKQRMTAGVNGNPLPRKPSAGSTSEDQELEIVFWESIKDADDTEMYKEYLRQFPNGVFAGLAKIRMAQLLLGNTPQPQVPTAPEEQLQASLPPPGPKARIPSGRISLAIFPWHMPRARLSWGYPNLTKLTAEALGEVLGGKDVFSPVYTDYDLGKTIKTQPIDKDALTDAALKKIWKRESFFSDPQPNVDFICDLGRRLKIDYVLLYNVRIEDQNAGIPIDYNARLILIDVHRKTLFSRSQSIFYRTYFDSVKKFTRKALAQFMERGVSENSNAVAVELAKIRTVQLPQKNTPQHKVPTASEEQLQASLPPGPKPRVGSEQLSMAVFPWHMPKIHLSWDYRNLPKLTAEALGEVMRGKDAFSPVYTYYDLGKTVKTTPIDRDVLTDVALKKIWIKKSSSSDAQPNIDFICDLGRRMMVDLVLLYRVRIGGQNEGERNVTLYLIDVHTQSLFFRSQWIYFRFYYDRVKKFTQESLTQFMEHSASQKKS